MTTQIKIVLFYNKIENKVLTLKILGTKKSKRLLFLAIKKANTCIKFKLPFTDYLYKLLLWTFIY